MAHHSLRTPWLHSRALPVAVVVFLMTALGCGLGDWERPTGRHGYQLMDPGWGIIIANSSGTPVTPGEWKVARIIESDDWLLAELRDKHMSDSLPPRWMVMDMQFGRVNMHPSEAAARAALPAALRSEKLREPSSGGLFVAARDAIIVVTVGSAVLMALVLFRVYRRSSRTSPRPVHTQSPPPNITTSDSR